MLRTLFIFLSLSPSQDLPHKVWIVRIRIWLMTSFRINRILKVSLTRDIPANYYYVSSTEETRLLITREVSQSLNGKKN